MSITMDTTTKLSPMHYFCFTLLLSLFTLSYATDFPICNTHDQNILLKVRDHFGGPNGRLSDWDNNTNCCSDWNFLGCGTEGKSYGRIDTVTFSRSWGLSGTIPSYFGDLPFLSYFILADNINITGTIPKSFSKLKKLYHLELSMNSLTGHIPKEVFQLKSLKEVDLSHNKLTGSLPPLLSKKLKSVDVSFNELCGPIPAGLERFGRKSFAHNKCLCGPPLAPCA